MNDFLTFRKMITPVFIQIIFWIGVVLCVISGLTLMIAGAGSNYGGGGQILTGLVTLFVGPLFVRVYCEILILFFRMNETLNDIRNEISKKVTIH